MKVLVTGASGFLGSWICRVLSHEHEVIALLRPNSDDYRLGGIDNLQIRRADPKTWDFEISSINADVVILNDWWGVGNEFRNEERQFGNVTRFKSNLKSAYQSNPKLIIGIGSQAELGPVSGSISESQKDNPTTKYGQSKVIARKELFELTANSAVRAIWIRIFSTYGPLDSAGWLIPDTINKLSNNQIMELTRGEQIWSYLHAYDLASAISHVIRENQIHGIVNTGNPNPVQIRDVVQEISQILGKRELLKFGAIPYRDDQVMELRPICEQLISAGWSPKIDLRDGLAHLISWYKGSNTPLKSIDGTEIDLKLPSVSH